MNQRYKQKWIDALRSKKYKQGTHELQGGPNTFCCLGVLCDISDAAHKAESKYANGWFNRDIPLECNLKRFGLDDDDTDDKISVVQRLINMNDDKKWSFRRIATWIEKNL